MGEPAGHYATRSQPTQRDTHWMSPLSRRALGSQIHRDGKQQSGRSCCDGYRVSVWHQESGDWLHHHVNVLNPLHVNLAVVKMANCIWPQLIKSHGKRSGAISDLCLKRWPVDQELVRHAVAELIPDLWRQSLHFLKCFLKDGVICREISSV